MIVTKHKVWPAPHWWDRLIKAIKEALAERHGGPNRAERRKEAKLKGQKRSDGKFRGNPSLKSARDEYKIQREVRRG